MLAGASQVAPPSRAAFHGIGSNASNSFTADTVTPPSGLSASTTCAPTIAPTYRASTTKAPSSSGTSISLNTPTTTVGDYLIAVLIVMDPER